MFIASKEELTNMIITSLLWKWYKKPDSSKRRPAVRPTEFYSAYKMSTRSLDSKKRVDEAFAYIESLGMIEIKREEYSSDVVAAYLVMDRIHDLEALALERGLKVREKTSAKAIRLKERYGGVDNRIDKRLDFLICGSRKEPFRFDLQIDRDEEVIKAAVFALRNEEALFIREASMLIYGDSKELESKEDQVLALLSAQSLDIFNIYHTDHLVRFRGPVQLHFDDTSLDASRFISGIAVSMEDIKRSVRRIEINASSLLTVENETSFLRHLPEGYASLFLSGFATRAQLSVLERIKRENPDLKISHFGDIDAGGLRILNHLRASLGNIEAYHMGIEDIKAPQYEKCLRPLTTNDTNNLASLRDAYPELVGYMLENNVKLEQEIVSLNLEKGLSSFFSLEYI